MSVSERLRNGMIVQHFKGQLYKIMFQSTHTETGELLVHYYAIPNKVTTIELWARPKRMFDDFVEHDGQQVPRFTIVD